MNNKIDDKFFEILPNWQASKPITPYTLTNLRNNKEEQDFEDNSIEKNIQNIIMEKLQKAYENDDQDFLLVDDKNKIRLKFDTLSKFCESLEDLLNIIEPKILLDKEPNKKIINEFHYFMKFLGFTNFKVSGSEMRLKFTFGDHRSIIKNSQALISKFNSGRLIFYDKLSDETFIENLNNKKLLKNGDNLCDHHINFTQYFYLEAPSEKVYSFKNYNDLINGYTNLMVANRSLLGDSNHYKVILMKFSDDYVDYDYFLYKNFNEIISNITLKKKTHDMLLKKRERESQEELEKMRIAIEWNKILARTIYSVIKNSKIDFMNTMETSFDNLGLASNKYLQEMLKNLSVDFDSFCEELQGYVRNSCSFRDLHENSCNDLLSVTSPNNKTNVRVPIFSVAKRPDFMNNLTRLISVVPKKSEQQVSSSLLGILSDK